MANPSAGTRLRQVAREKLGLERLRPGQEDAVKALLTGRDVLAVMPTGWGKSAIYQIAGAQLSGPTVIVSPLIALQNDQVETLRSLDLGRAELLNSQLGVSQRAGLLADFARGEIGFLFLAPEQLQNDEVLAAVKEGAPGLFVVDEAHCICEWGHDFRPDYAKLGGVVDALEHPCVLALTATAAPPIRREIWDRLSLDDPLVLVHGFDRSNISLEVRRFESEEAQLESLIEEVIASPKPGIVYVATRKSSDGVAATLCERGISAVAYHAGLSRAARDESQAVWMNGDAEVVVATTAFGMGIDKPDVRWVYHLHIAESLDAYYQEIGRAGRDGEAARAVLFYRAADLNLRRFFAAGGNITDEHLEPVVELLRDEPDGIKLQAVQEEVDLPDARVASALRLLERAGAVEEESGRLVLADDEAATERALRLQEQNRQFERSRVEMMQAYAETTKCRREFILNYFGEEYRAPCNACDNCLRTSATATVTQTRDESAMPELFPLGSTVAHSQWGHGQVLRYEDDKIVVLFEEAGYKTLDLRLVEEKQLLQPVE